MARGRDHLADLMQLRTPKRPKRRLGRLHHVLLQCTVDLRPLHGGRPRAHGLEGLDPHRVGRHPHRHSSHLRRGAHGLVGDEVALPEVAVGHDELEAGLLQAPLGGLEPVRREQLLVLLDGAHQIRPVEHADVRHEVREVARVGDVHHVGPLADHLVDLLARAQLFTGKDLNLNPTVGAGSHVLREELSRQMGRLRGGQRVREADADRLLRLGREDGAGGQSGADGQGGSPRGEMMGHGLLRLTGQGWSPLGTHKLDTTLNGRCRHRVCRAWLTRHTRSLIGGRRRRRVWPRRPDACRPQVAIPDRSNRTGRPHAPAWRFPSAR